MGDLRTQATASFFFEMLLWLEGEQEKTMKMHSRFSTEGSLAYKPPEPYKAKACLGN